MGDITKNFSYYEFKPYGATDCWVPVSHYQKLLIITLAHTLQEIRNELNVKIRITCGVREATDYLRLKNNGYFPSSISDHYFGNVVPIDVNTHEYVKFGKYYIFSTGAADIQPEIDLNIAFHKIIEMVKANRIKVKQVILEEGHNTKWIHISNSSELLFSDSFIKTYLWKDKFLQSNDNGKTYQKVNS